MKPNPLSSLNHFTVPVGMTALPPFAAEPSMRPTMTTRGDGWTAASLDEIGEGYGFRKVRKELGIEAFGANAIVMPPGIETGFHWHDQQDELYFVHRGTIEIAFGDGSSTVLEAGSFAHIQAATQRKFKNVGDD